MKFTLAHQSIDVSSLRNSMKRVDAGGFCVFEGWVRDHHLGKGVERLDYEAYEKLALKQGTAVLTQALARYDILDVRAEHRIGTLPPGDLAIWLGVSAVHRDEAFAACRWTIDEIKATVPIWKHEFYTDGSDEWVDPTACQCSHRHEHREATA